MRKETIRTSIPHLSFLNDEITKVSGMKATDIYNYPRTKANNFLGSLKSNEYYRKNKHAYLGETLKLLEWFTRKTATIKQNSLYHFHQKIDGEYKDVLNEYLQRDYDSSRESMIRQIIEQASFEMPLCLDWVRKNAKNVQRKYPGVGKDGLRWDESVRLNNGKTIINDGTNPPSRDDLPSEPQYIYSKSFSELNPTRAYEEIEYLDNRLPLIIMGDTYYPSNNDKFTLSPIPGIQILVRQNNHRKGYVLICYSQDGKVEKRYFDHDPFFKGDDKKLQETLVRIGVPSEADVENIDQNLLRIKFFEYANKGKPIDSNFYREVIGEVYKKPKRKINKDLQRRVDHELMMMRGTFDKEKAKRDFLEQINCRLISEYITRKETAYGQPKQYNNFRKLMDAVDGYRNIIKEYEYIVDSVLSSYDSEDESTAKLWINNVEENLNDQIEAIKRHLKLPVIFQGISWLKEKPPIFGTDYTYYDGELKEIDHKDTINKDHYQYSTDTSFWPWENEKKREEKFVETLSIHNGNNMKALLVYREGTGGKTARRIHLYVISDKKNSREKSITYYGDGRRKVHLSDAGGDENEIKDKKAALKAKGIPRYEEAPLRIDFNKTWEKFITIANSGLIPENILELFI